MSKNVRVSGHELQAEGSAFRFRLGERKPSRVHEGWSAGVGGIGFGLCSCGARSTDLRSGNLRKAWHRTHKADVLAERSVTP